MAAATWKGSIKVGLVQFPVKAVAADREIKFAFNMHHAPDGGRLRSQLSLCEICGNEVPKEEVVRGYKGVAGVDEEYLDSLEKERSSVLEVEAIVPSEAIEPRMYKRSYDVIADQGGEVVYALFARLLTEKSKVMIGKMVGGGQEHLVAIRPRQGVLEMELLWWPEEMKSDAEARASVEGAAPSEKDVTLAGMLVDGMTAEFKPESYRSEYKAKVGEYLAAFVAGKEPVKLEARPMPHAPALSLTDALAQSLAAITEVTPPKPKKGKKEAAA